MKNKRLNNTIRKNVYIDNEVNLEVLKFSSEKELNYSRSVNLLLDIGLRQTDLDKDIAYIKSKTSFIASKVVYNQKLLEQIFSDLNIELNTNPDINMHLKEFGKRFSKDKSSD